MDARAGQFGLFTWFKEHGTEHVHQDDMHLFDSDHPHGHVFELIGEEGDYTLMRYAGGQVRVLPGLFREVSAPRFKIGETVEVLPPRTSRAGMVAAIMWHHKRAEPMFFLRVDGRRISGRYWASELSKLPN